MEHKTHWDNVYTQKQPGEVSWYQPHLTVSLTLLAKAGLHPGSRVIDAGGGASTLVDDLLARGVQNITVLDLSAQALAASKVRLGQRAVNVQWIAGDMTRVPLPQSHYDLWHDRAVFHFLTQPDDRRRYVDAVRGALTSNGQLVMAAFSLHGPPRCSGLDVIRYSPETLHAEFGSEFRLMDTFDEEHRTPFNTTQHFVYCRFQRVMPTTA